MFPYYCYKTMRTSYIENVEHNNINTLETFSVRRQAQRLEKVKKRRQTPVFTKSVGLYTK